jgi:adenine deaminase
VKNAKLVNVLSGEVHEANVAIADGIFVGFEEEEEEYNTEFVRCSGKVHVTWTY